MRVPYTIPRLQKLLLTGIAFGIPLSAWGALYPHNTYLQIAPVIILLLAAIPALHRWPISNRGVLCITAFVLLHLFAGRWSYSFVPYDDWSKTWLGFDFNQATGFNRNMFDRLVHFLFGFWIVFPIAEITGKYGGLSQRWSLTIALMFVMAISCLYEIFEWLLTMGLAPADAGAYNGEQGDIYDSQKDMACAVVGSLLGLTKLLFKKS